MIDYNLIEQNTQQLTASLTTATPIWSPYLYGIKNCLTDSMLDKLHAYATTVSDDSWGKVERQLGYNRSSINWDSDTVIEEAHVAFDSITDALSKRYAVPLHFHGVQLWKDQSGYNIKWHTDNTVIAVSLQIYLFDAGSEFGTTFLVHDQQEFDMPFEHNTGYLARITTEQDLYHRSTNTIPENLDRYSLYAYWSLEPKRK